MAAKIDGLQELCSDLKATVEAKDREILKIRSIAAHHNAATRVRRAGKKTVDEGVQTVLKLQQTGQLHEQTYLQLYERDLTLIRSEKDALLRYMRESVKDNGEFMQRIRELEDEKEELLVQVAEGKGETERLRAHIEELNAEMVSEQNR